MALSRAALLSVVMPLVGVRGVTIGPIENALHPHVGYGSTAYVRTLDGCAAWGATYVAITPFGRVNDLEGGGVDPTFEAPFEENRVAVARAIHMAHARGLGVMLVPHLWVESGGWRALIDPGTDEGWARWARSYQDFVARLGRVAEAEHAEISASGSSCEAGSRVATPRVFARSSRRAPRLSRARHVLGELGRRRRHRHLGRARRDRHQRVLSARATRRRHGERAPRWRRAGARRKIARAREAWHRPVSSTEIGYTTRPDPAVKPWEWPDRRRRAIDEHAQAAAYRGSSAPSPRRARPRRVLRVAGLRRPRRRLPGGRMGVFAEGKDGRARGAGRVCRALGYGPGPRLAQKHLVTTGKLSAASAN